MTKVIDLTVNVVSMSNYLVEVRGHDALLMNKMIDLSVPKTEKKTQAREDPVEREYREWSAKIYLGPDGLACVPGENVHECLKEGAKYWGAKIPGEGQKTYTDLVASSCIVEQLSLGVGIEKFVPFGKETNGTPSKGKKSGAKVFKVRPLLRPWGGSFVLHVMDARLTDNVLRSIVAYAGMYRGLCDWRPTYGRFDLMSLSLI